MNRQMIPQPLLGVLLLGAALVTPLACGGSDRPLATSPTPSAMPTAPREPAEWLQSLLPSGWSATDTVIAPDGAYAAVIEKHMRPNLVYPPGGIVVVYRLTRDGATELGRVPWCCGAPVRSDDVTGAPLAPLALQPDGTRMLILREAADRSGRRGPDTVISIAMSNTVAVTTPRYSSYDSPLESLSLPPPPADPVSVVTMPALTPEYGIFSQNRMPPQPLPAGAVSPGWSLVDAAAAPDGRRFAVITAWRSQWQLRQLSLWELRNGQLIELWRQTAEDIAIDRKLAFHDINRDGKADLPYDLWLGGNSSFSLPSLMLSIADDGLVEDVVFATAPEVVPAGPADIDGDGIYEWWAVDNTWLLKVFSHADSPTSRRVLAWDGVQYSEASERFRDAIVSWRTDPTPPAERGCRYDVGYLSALVGRFLDYANAGDEDGALRMVATIESFPFDPGAEALRREVLARLLAKPGAPTPTRERILGHC